MWSYPNANLLLVLDSRRNIRRLMELVAMFDSDVLAKQRVRVFEVVNTRPSLLAKELETVLQSVSLSKESLEREVPARGPYQHAGCDCTQPGGLHRH